MKAPPNAASDGGVGDHSKPSSEENVSQEKDADTSTTTETKTGVANRGATIQSAPPSDPSSSGSGASDASVATIQADAPSMLAAMNNMNCFPADSLVTTVMGKKRMDELQVGDFVSSQHVFQLINPNLGPGSIGWKCSQVRESGNVLPPTRDY